MHTPPGMTLQRRVALTRAAALLGAWGIGAFAAAEGWAAVLADEALRADPIHANVRGHAQMARSVFDAALAHGLAQVR